MRDVLATCLLMFATTHLPANEHWVRGRALVSREPLKQYHCAIRPVLVNCFGVATAAICFMDVDSTLEPTKVYLGELQLEPGMIIRWETTRVTTAGTVRCQFIGVAIARGGCWYLEYSGRLTWDGSLG